jgi:hypothetical protein
MEEEVRQIDACSRLEITGLLNRNRLKYRILWYVIEARLTWHKDSFSVQPQKKLRKEPLNY